MMKKKYVLILAFSLLGITMQAQWNNIFFDFMGYPEGPIHENHWGSWSGNPGPEDLLSVSSPPFGGLNTGYIGGDQIQDAVLKLGDRTSGIYHVEWQMYIPAGKTAYYNIQELEDTSNGGNWALNVYFNRNGSTPGVGEIFDDNQNLLTTFTYPENIVFNYGWDVDLDTDIITITTIDNTGNIAYEGPMYSNGGNLGGVNFYSVNSNTEFYIDFVRLDFFGTLNNEEFESPVALQVAPNPVSDVLRIETLEVADLISLYDTSGREIVAFRPNAISESVDMSKLASGIYLLKATIGNQTSTVKILKQ